MAESSRGCVLVTGGAQRLGRALALRFAKEGRDIAIHYRASATEAELLREEIAAMGRRAETYRADLTDLDAAGIMIERVAGDFSRIEGLVNSASIFERDDLPTMTPAFFRSQMAVNAEAPLFLTQSFWKLAEEPGWVLNLIDSKIAQLTPAFLSYTLSKLALEDVTRMMAMACAPRLRVNAIAPGLVLRSGDQTDAQFARVHDKTPLGKGPTQDDIADMAVALANADTTTGQIVTVDGGRHFYSPDSVRRD